MTGLYRTDAEAADELLTILFPDLAADDLRTDGGSVNMPKVRTLIAERRRLTVAQSAPAAPSVPETLTCTCHSYPHTAWCYPLASALHLGAPVATRGLRMLTQAELADLVNIYYEGNIDPVLAIRKFCEVNGLGEPS